MTAPAAGVALGATLILLAALIVLHAAPTGLSPLSAPVSAYALTRFRAGYAVAALAAAVAGAAVAVLLAGIPRTRTAVALLCVFAAARALIPLFPMDRPGAAATRHGQLHRLLAIVAFGTVTVAAFAAATPLADAGLGALGSASTATGTLMALGTILMLGRAAGGPLRRTFGLTERLVYAGFIAWFLILSIGQLAS